MEIVQRRITLAAQPRGVHLVTREILAAVPEVARFRVGLATLFIQHTSASLTLNENADPTVRSDFEAHLNAMVPENAPYFEHTLEGPDDMPAHLKASLMGSAVSVPITDGRLALGTWQGVYLCEHRDRGGPRSLVVTLMGRTDEVGRPVSGAEPASGAAPSPGAGPSPGTGPSQGSAPPGGRGRP